MCELPTIVKFLSISDAGEFGAASCPHCGAAGRYVYKFVCSDGVERGAMAGCIKKFPMHFLAREHQRIIDKQTDYQKKGWNLPSWDLAILDLIEKRISGAINDKKARAGLNYQKERMVKHGKNKYG